jgi:hypothetical protein
MHQEQTRETRRRFLATVAIVAGGLAAAARLGARNPLVPEADAFLAGQAPVRRGSPPSPPPPAEAQDDTKTEQGLDPQSIKKAQLRKTEKEVRDGVDRLYALAGSLRDDMAQTPSTGVLSVRTYKKMEEIEKLAKELKTKTKG